MFWKIEGNAGIDYWMAVDLTKLSKKEEFHWDVEVDKTFLKLKELTQPLVLALLKFSQGFIIEFDVGKKNMSILDQCFKFYFGDHSDWSIGT